MTLTQVACSLCAECTQTDTTRHALERSSCSQGLGLEQGAACHPPDPHKFFHYPGGGDSRLFGPMCLLLIN